MLTPRVTNSSTAAWRRCWFGGTRLAGVAGAGSGGGSGAGGTSVDPPGVNSGGEMAGGDAPRPGCSRLTSRSSASVRFFIK